MTPAPTELPVQNLEAPAFSAAKIRIEKSQRIAADLKPQDGRAPNQSRITEVRDIERRSAPGPAAAKSGLKEVVIDTREYQERVLKAKYKTDSGAEMSEELVMFFKLGRDGQPQFLTVDGQPLALNGDLYRTRLDSQLHKPEKNVKTTVLPRIDGRGAYTGIVSIREKNEVAEKAPRKPDGRGPSPLPAAGTERQSLQDLARDKEKFDVPAKAILDKIKAAGTMGRLGIEVSFAPQELVQLEQLFTETRGLLATNPILMEFTGVINQYRGKNKAFDILMGFGGAIVEDSTVSTPTVMTTDAGPKIRVPSPTFHLWKLQNDVQGAQFILTSYREKPLKRDAGNVAYGTSAGGFGRLVSSALEAYKM